jgi:hypothetical protein
MQCVHANDDRAHAGAPHRGNGRVTKAARATASEPDAQASCQAIERAIASVQRRLRWQRAADAASLAGALALTGLGPLLLYSKLHPAHRGVPLSASFTWVVALPCLAAVLAGLRHVPHLQTAQLIDRSHRLADLIASGWSFAQQPSDQHTPFMRATLSRAATRSQTIESARAWPWRWPSSLLLWPFLASGLACVGFLRPTPSAAAGAAQQMRPARLLPRDEVAAALRSLARAPASAEDASLREATVELERLLALIAQQGIDRVELLRALDALESRLAQASRHSADQQSELRELGHALAGPAITQQLSAALANADLVAGRAALQKLAHSVGSAPDSRELDRLRAALHRALAKQEQTRRARMAEAIHGLESSLKKPGAEATPQDLETQRAAKRQLDELLREEREQRQAARDDAAASSGQSTSEAQTPAQAPRERELDQLKRELDDAAHGGNDAQQTARDIQSAADTMQRMQRASDHDRALDRLNERVAELRQRLAENQPQPQAADERKQPENQDGKSLTLGQFQRLARGEPAQNDDSAKPDNDAAAQGAVLRQHTPNGPPPQAADQTSLLERRVGSPENAPSAEGRVQTGEASQSVEATQDVALAGLPGRGPSRSSVIYDAAAHGFGTRAYEKVHADYREHAESELEREALPAGYRFYVHRYFELIQPRQDAHD